MAILAVKSLSLTAGDPPRQVLENIDFSCEPGTINLLLGANGSGKSVLLRTMLGLFSGYTGEIVLEEQSLRNDFEQLHRRSGVVFQNPEVQLFGSTVREDLSISLPSGGRPDEAVIEAFGLEGLLDLSPGELSGGQRRRLAIAGAIVANPDFLFLDEPFIELDYPAIRNLLRLLQCRRDRGCTVILASHESGDIWPLVDQLLIISAGSIRYRGPRENGRNMINESFGLRPLNGGTRFSSPSDEGQDAGVVQRKPSEPGEP